MMLFLNYGRANEGHTEITLVYKVHLFIKSGPAAGEAISRLIKLLVPTCVLLIVDTAPGEVM